MRIACIHHHVDSRSSAAAARTALLRRQRCAAAAPLAPPRAPPEAGPRRPHTLAARRAAAHADAADDATAAAAAASAAPSVTVRRALPGDVPALARIEALCAGGSAGWSAADIEAELTRDIARCLVAVVAPPPPVTAGNGDGGGGAAAALAPDSAGSGGAVAGFVAGWLVAGELQILELAVHPAARRRGAARALLRALLTECGCCGDATGDANDAGDGAPATLELRAGNEAAAALYRSAGFEAVGRRPRYYADGDDALLMTRPPGPLPR